MKSQQVSRPLSGLISGVVLLTAVCCIPGVFAQTFDSGSTEVNGAFPPAAVPAGTTAITLSLVDGVVTFLPGNTTVTLPGVPAGAARRRLRLLRRPQHLRGVQRGGGPAGGRMRPRGALGELRPPPL